MRWFDQEGTLKGFAAGHLLRIECNGALKVKTNDRRRSRKMPFFSVVVAPPLLPGFVQLNSVFNRYESQWRFSRLRPFSGNGQ
jgi:hypothetical protein